MTNQITPADLETLIFSQLSEEWGDALPDSIETFEDAGVLTMDSGLVVRYGEREFQITIVQSR